MRSLRASEQRPTPSRKERRRASVSCFKWSWVTASANNGATEANTFSLTMSTNCGRASPKSWRMSLRELAKAESAPNSGASHTAIRRESPMLMSLTLFKKGSQSTVWQDTAERTAAPPSSSFNSRRAAARSDSNKRTTARNSETTMASSDRGALHKDSTATPQTARSMVSSGGASDHEAPVSRPAHRRMNLSALSIWVGVVRCLLAFSLRLVLSSCLSIASVMTPFWKAANEAARVECDGAPAAASRMTWSALPFANEITSDLMASGTASRAAPNGTGGFQYFRATARSRRARRTSGRRNRQPERVSCTNISKKLAAAAKKIKHTGTMRRIRREEP
mmetsp:Transcript_156744/g.500193  ORF Transcript_156744/g.500193 Transcript_156744/m.500193 type:complete len:336 (-) Transcript_156744:65-1072(-)